MILGIDASNIRVGGGVTHLVELLRVAEPSKFGFSKVVVWGCARTLGQIEDRPDWLEKRHEAVFERGVVSRAFWQSRVLSRRAREENCDVLFVPGGSFRGNFFPIVSMSQNLLPFEWRELKRFGFALMTLKMVALRYTQGTTFKRADGVLFLTEYAKRAVERAISYQIPNSAVVPLGLHDRFSVEASAERLSAAYGPSRPCKLLYVSVVDVYKHQWHVVEAARILREQGCHVTLDIVGAAVGAAEIRLNEAIRKADPGGSYIHYRGKVPYETISEYYRNCDVNVFASSCENMPNILLEAMASGVPVACSKLGPMPEVLKDAGVYFDPECPVEIASAIKELIDSPDLRVSCVRKAKALVVQYSWRRCADETFAFLEHVAQRRG